MKKHEWRYAIKTGFQGLRRHPLLAAAAITTLALMLFLMSAFVAVSMNANHLSKVAAQQPPIEITMRVGVKDEELNDLSSFLRDHAYIQDWQMYTPQQNYDQFKHDMGKDELWKDFDYNLYIPYTFNARLIDPSYSGTFEEEIMELRGVKEVLMESNLMALLDNVKNWTSRAGIIVFLVLAVTAALVMANTVRIAALSRSREINIMKYVGATNAFIRIPFIVEGALIGITGALLASVTASLIYSQIVSRMNPGAPTQSASAFALLPGAPVSATLLSLNLVIGIILCVVVSGISVRKYARV
ncbi:MAG TPA: permease-like cell division protein FtsX [Clostridia bacterium]|nr:permease-like cell division protein FtsX [Clostridia bacterium]